MGIISFGFCVVLIHVILLPENSAENLFSENNLDPAYESEGIFSANILDLDYASQESSSSSDSDWEDSINTSIFSAENLPAEDSIFDVSVPSLAKKEPFITDDASEDDSMWLDSDSVLVSSNCDESAMNIFDTREVEDIFSGDVLIGSIDKKKKSPTSPPIKYTNVLPFTYPLDPNTPDDTPPWDAYAADGTPIQLGNCPRGKKQSCCIWDAVPPFSQCWNVAGNKAACKFAKNRFCCREVLQPGGIGLDCEPTRWNRARDSRPVRKSSESSSSNEFELQELFPILQNLPELPDSSPNLCLPGARF